MVGGIVVNPVLIILILIGGGLIWLLCSFLYQPIGKLFKKLMEHLLEDILFH